MFQMLARLRHDLWRQPFAKLVLNPPAGYLQEPRFKRASLRIILEVRDFLRNFEDRLLHDVFALRFRQSRSVGDIKNKSPVGGEEVAPTLAIIPVFQAAQ